MCTTHVRYCQARAVTRQNIYSPRAGLACGEMGVWAGEEEKDKGQATHGMVSHMSIIIMLFTDGWLLLCCELITNPCDNTAPAFADHITNKS